MKTIEEYILEKQNFIFGGKAGLTGKEYGDGKDLIPIDEWEVGDSLHVWKIDGDDNMVEDDAAHIIDIINNGAIIEIELSDRNKIRVFEYSESWKYSKSIYFTCSDGIDFIISSGYISEEFAKKIQNDYYSA